MHSVQVFAHGACTSLPLYRGGAWSAHSRSMSAIQIPLSCLGLCLGFLDVLEMAGGGKTSGVHRWFRSLAGFSFVFLVRQPDQRWRDVVVSPWGLVYPLIEY